MRKFITTVLIIGVVSICGYFFCRGGTTFLYSQYGELSWYRRLTPGLLPSASMMKLGDAGHTTTHADTLWINLIQYIGDNTRNNLFLEFLYPIVDRITDLHPAFPAPYRLAVLLAPNPDKERGDYEKNLALAKEAKIIGEKGMKNICDSGKLARIRNTDISPDLWANTDLKNPCRDGMLPYYLASVTDRLSERGESENYYKIASMNTDAPEVSRFLALLMRAKEGNYEDAGRKFLLIGASGYDEPPYDCQKNIGEVLMRFATGGVRTEADIEFIKTRELQLTPPKDTKNPLASSVTSCYDSGNRGIKQLYISYIDTLAKSLSGAITGSGLRASGYTGLIPSVESQKGWDIKQLSDGSWQYIRP